MLAAALGLLMTSAAWAALPHATGDLSGAGAEAGQPSHASPATGTGDPGGARASGGNGGWAPPRAQQAAAGAGPSFAPPVNLPDSNGFAEPSIAVAPDGTMYIVAPGTATWRSDDLGASWIRVADTLGNGGDADVAVDADGVLYASDLSNSAPVSVSFDRGATYEFSTTTNSGGSLDRQWLTVAGSGIVYATVRQAGDEELSISHDHGRTFTDPITVAQDATWRGNIYAPDAQDLYVPYDSGDIHIAISHDGGLTWTTRDVAPSPGSACIFPAVARDAAGTLYVTWCEYGNVGYPASGPARIWLASSQDDGVTWTPPIVLSDDAKYNLFPWILAGDAGRVFVTWYEGEPIVTDPGFRDPNIALADWKVVVAWASDADQASPTFQRVDATGIMHTGPICTNGTGCVPGTRGLLDFFEMAEMEGGNVAITYAGGDTIPPQPSQNLGTTVSLFAVVQTGGESLREP